MTSDNLDFLNAAALVEEVGRAVPKLESHDLLYNLISNPMTFFTCYGECIAAINYARFGKISKELAVRTLSRFLKVYQQDIQNILQELEEINGG
jgi:hypothetical protein